MRGSAHQVSPNGALNKGVAELNNDTHEEHKEVTNGIVGEGQGLSEEDESRINEGAVPAASLQASLQKQQKQQQLLPPGPVVLWDKILPVRTLKVLLVESDDSTRQVVSALLRNCSYEVTAAANGLQAWKILENPTNHIDLVLTEVVMPGLSGISLLSKIMSKDTSKNIPVIMMSSNDSMGTVFKCLSKGAVDFLVKPIRKNELKNLWQHVWRRSHSSSGSVSESGIQTQKSSKSTDVSDNNSTSNDEDDNASIGMNARDGSDNGSGTQSSWTKHAVEIDSPQPMSPSDQLPDPHDSTCAQVISDRELLCNKWVPTTAIKCQKQNKHADAFMGKHLEIGVPRNPDVPPESHPIENMMSKSTEKQPESEKNKDLLGLESSNPFDDLGTEAADLVAGIAKNTDAQLVTGDTASRPSESKDKKNADTMELPSLQLSLKRLRSTGEGNNAAHDDRNTLRRSDQSAFSRYRTSAASTQALTGYVGSCSPIDNSSEIMKTESTQNMISNSNPAIAKQGSNGSSDNNDKGSTTNPAAYKENAASALPAKSSSHPSAFHPVQVRTSHQVVIEKIDDMETTTVVGNSTGVQCQYQVQHHHHHYHHHHHHVHSMKKQPQVQQSSEHEESSRKNMKAAAQHCGSSNVFSGPIEGNAANYSSLNGSNSGSNNGSDGQNGSSACVNAGANMETPNGIAEKHGVVGGNGSGSGSGSGVDQNRLAQREAALNKFRQKRKERNFGKKVRYQSRQRLHSNDALSHLDIVISM
ncbi:two-component response regulator-like PRR73 [Asparagus officinalis]|uniref:two-component response regulator-like PRR73 n=1 Tax=Asparagus officinalis TaxID=4686 RepID=UPI00098E05C5|nr:two-component response regulator-like PRR73 [Asparagus officinalis]